MSKLPPLPEHNREFLCTKCGSRECQGDIKDPHPHCFKCGYLGFSSDVGYEDAQMSEYGQLCRDQAIDEVARFINGGSFLHDQSPEKLFANQLVQKILELK